MAEKVSVPLDLRGHVMTIRSGSIVEAAIAEQNAWWTPDQINGLVGQRPWLTDESTNRKWQVEVTRAWAQDGMICVRMEPYDDGSGS